MKIFVNVCYDKNVPPPPAGSEEAIQRAMKGEDDQRKTDGGEEEDSEEWYVPVVVSEPRTDKDKSGKESVVVDCVYNAEVRKRTLRDPEFKVFLVGAFLRDFSPLPSPPFLPFLFRFPLVLLLLLYTQTRKLISMSP